MEESCYQDTHIYAMSEFDFYKSLYEHEVDVRHYYDGRIHLVYLVLSATAIAIASNIAFEINHTSDVGMLQFHLGLTVVSCIIFFFQLLFMFSSFFSFRYKYRDFPVDRIEDEVKKYFNKNKKSNEHNQQTEQWKCTKELLCDTYKKCVKTYYQENINKRKKLHVLNLLTFFNFIVLIITSLIVEMG